LNKNHFSKLVFAAFTILYSNFCIASSDHSEIENLFKKYKESILAKDSLFSVQNVSKETKKFFDEILHTAKYGEKKDLLAKSLLEHSTVVLYRQMINRDTLSNLNGSSLIKLSVEKGFSGEHNYAKLTIGEINVNGENAFAALNFNGNSVPNRFYFTQENGLWKINLVEVIKESEKYLKYQFNKSGATETEFVLTYVGYATKTYIKDDIYTPPFKL